LIVQVYVSSDMCSSSLVFFFFFFQEFYLNK